MNPLLITAIVLVDVAITAVVLLIIFRRNGVLAGTFAQIGQLAGVATELEREAKEYLAANWSGDPATLPESIEPLLAKLDESLRARGLQIERPQLKAVVLQILVRQQGANAGNVREAMKRVA